MCIRTSNEENSDEAGSEALTVMLSPYVERERIAGEDRVARRRPAGLLTAEKIFLAC